jgi:tetratricopeptide (TPR) repeat protein
MDAPATQSAGFIKFQAWFEVNKKRALIGAAVAVVLGVAIFLAINYQSQREGRASEALSEIKVPPSPMSPPPPGTVDAYLKIARDYKGTHAGGRALIHAATTLFVQADYDEAQKLFEQFAREYQASPFAAQAMFGVAECLDAKKKTAEAIAKLEELRRRYGKSSVIDEVKLALGRLYEEQNKPAQAWELYDELLKANQFGGQFSGIGSEAGMRMQELELKHPELKKTPPPMTPPVAMQQNTNLMVRMMTNPPTGTNISRTTSSIPRILMTNINRATGGTSIPKINVTTNK